VSKKSKSNIITKYTPLKKFVNQYHNKVSYGRACAVKNYPDSTCQHHNFECYKID
jgi:hypothetical protein